MTDDAKAMKAAFNSGYIDTIVPSIKRVLAEQGNTLPFRAIFIRNASSVAEGIENYEEALRRARDPNHESSVKWL